MALPEAAVEALPRAAVEVHVGVSTVSPKELHCVATSAKYSVRLEESEHEQALTRVAAAQHDMPAAMSPEAADAASHATIIVAVSASHVCDALLGATSVAASEQVGVSTVSPTATHTLATSP